MRQSAPCRLLTHAVYERSNDLAQCGVGGEVPIRPRYDGQARTVGVSKEMRAVAPVPIDRRLCDARRLADSLHRHRARTAFDKQGNRCREHRLARTAYARIDVDK